MFFSKENIDDCAKLEDKFLDVLNKHVPLKRHERLSKCNAICSGFVFKLTRNQGMCDRGFKLFAKIELSSSWNVTDLELMEI